MELAFFDGRLGRRSARAGLDFGDFIVWRKDNIPAYQLAVVADDAAMGMTEVVRGEDLLASTFRQLLFTALWDGRSRPGSMARWCGTRRESAWRKERKP